MKEVTLKFREVAVDGLPKESMGVFVNYGYGTASTDYSKKHKCFCCTDQTSKKDARSRRNIWNGVKFWVPLSEFKSAFEEDAPNAD